MRKLSSLALVLVTAAFAGGASRLRASTEPVGEPDLSTLASPSALTPEETLARHLVELRKRVPQGFTVVVRSPFVIIGDEAPDRVRRRADDTVQWTMSLLEKDFFPKAPSELTDVWIFKDAQSYVGHAKSLFHETPTTPYGYYSASAHAMLMNIKPGAGTLVHELVHPYMHANAPDCPAWLNEGLASLYERPGERNGHLYGYPNWRLPALQRGLREGTLPSFAEFTALGDTAFYDDDDGTHYAQARYVVYYLQEKGLLRDFFADYLAHRDEDRTGYAALSRALGDVRAAETDWRKQMLALRYR